jgi:molecular chaperone IbpA
MTRLPSIFDSAFKDFDRFFVGFDDQLARFHEIHDAFAKNIPNYPPYNLKKVGENKYVIEVAVAGFAKTDIDITLEDDKLIIKGESKSSDEDEKSDSKDVEIFKGIANRAFERTFALSENIEVKDAQYLNGMLKVILEKIIPEHKKPKKVSIK